MKKRLIGFPYVAFLIIFTVIPLSLFFYYGLTIETEDGIVFSLQNFSKFFSSSAYISIFVRSVWLAFISTVICLLIGYPVALVLASKPYRDNSILLFLLVIPMWMNLLLRTYSWLTILENTGLLNSFLGLFGISPKTWLYGEGSIVFGMVYNFVSFMILPIYSTLVKISDNYIEAAQDLGAGPFTVFKKVIFPLSMPGVFSGITMVFMPAVTTFAISSILSGRKIHLIGNLIEEQFLAAYDWHFGSTISLILIVVILASMAIFPNKDADNQGGGLF